MQPYGKSFGCPVLSILEGGYDLDAIADSAKAHVQALFRDVPLPSGGLPVPPPVAIEEGDDDFKTAAAAALLPLALPQPPLYPAN